MDIVNTLENIIPKMRRQLNLRRIHSLDVLYKEIEKQNEHFNIRELDMFFAKFGIYLKSQEVTEVINHCRVNEGQINLVKFVYLFRTKVPEEIIKRLNKIFDKLSDGQPKMDVEELLIHLEISHHPRLSLFRGDIEKARESVLQGFSLLLGQKKLILREEFLEFHYNIFWTMPSEEVEKFIEELHLFWGLKKLFRK